MIADPTSIAELSSNPVSGMPSAMVTRENSSTSVVEKSAGRRPTIILITPTPNVDETAPKVAKEMPSPLREKSFKRERRNSFIPVFYVCKVYVNVNGSKPAPGHNVEPLLVEKDWTHDDFLTFAGRHIDMSNATRAFTRLGNQPSVSLSYLHSLIPILHRTISDSFS